MNAASSGDSERVKALIAAGEEVNARVDEHLDWTTALHCAAGGPDNVDSINALIAGGADVNAKDKEGWTPLLLAANFSRPEIVKALISAGADAKASRPGVDALGRPFAERIGETALMTAILCRGNRGEIDDRLGCISALIGAGADVNACDSNGYPRATPRMDS